MNNDVLDNIRKLTINYRERFKQTIQCAICTKDIRLIDTQPFSYVKDNLGAVTTTSIKVCSEECRQQLLNSRAVLPALMLNEESTFGSYLIPNSFLTDPFAFPQAWENSDNDRQREIFEIISDWFYSDQKTGFIFYGKPGTGKTCLAASIAIQYRIQEKSIRFISGFELALEGRELSKPYAKAEDVNCFLKKYVQADLLVIDELAGLNLEDVLLMNLLIKRHAEERPTIFTTNSTLESLQKQLPAHIFDRVMDSCQPIGFLFDSQRGR